MSVSDVVTFEIKHCKNFKSISK